MLVRKLMGALLIGCGGGEGSLTNKSRRDALNNLRYRDLHALLRIDEDLNKIGRCQSLYGSGGNHHRVGQKRGQGDAAHDINDDEEQELALQAKHAKLFEYYNKYKEHQEKRLQALLKVDNPLKRMNQMDYHNIKSYLDDYKNGLIKDLGKTYDLILKVPFSCLIVGKSKSGKTTLLLDILSQWRLYTTDETGEYEKRIFWIYGTENGKDFNKLNEIMKENYKNYGEEDRLPNIEYFKGKLKNPWVIDRIRAIPEKSIVILDDLMIEMVKSEEISNVLTREPHHKKWNVFLLWQDMYPQQQFAKTISLQCDYKYIFRDPPCQDRLRTLCLQMFPNGNEGREMFNKILHFFTSESSPEDYPYIRINLRPDSPYCLMIMANDLERDKRCLKLGIMSKPVMLFTY